MEKPQIIVHLQNQQNHTLFDCAWIPLNTKLVVVGSKPRGSGSIQIFDVSSTELKLITEAEKSSGFKCCTFGASRIAQRHLATGAFDGRLAIWDLERSATQLEMPIYGVKAHDEIVNAVDGVGGLGLGAPELATGSRDGLVKVWDPRQSKVPVATMEPESGGGRDCWTVAFGNSYNNQDRCLAAGYDNGDVKLFDLRAMKLKWETNIGNGVCCLQFDRKDIEMNKLVATTLEGKVHVWDMRTQHPSKGFASLTEKHHGATVWQVKHLPQQRDIFMTTAGNGSLCLWQYKYPNERRRVIKEKSCDDRGDTEVAEGVVGSLHQLQHVTFSTQPISSFDWCPEKLGLGICISFDQTIRMVIVTKLNKI